MRNDNKLYAMVTSYTNNLEPKVRVFDDQHKAEQCMKEEYERDIRFIEANGWIYTKLYSHSYCHAYIKNYHNDQNSTPYQADYFVTIAENHMTAEAKNEDANSYIAGYEDHGSVRYIPHSPEGDIQLFSSLDEAYKALTAYPAAHNSASLIVKRSTGICHRCGSPLFTSDTSGYDFQCFTCDEDFYSFEQKEG